MDPQNALDQANAIWSHILTKEQVAEILGPKEEQSAKRPRTGKNLPQKKQQKVVNEDLLKMVAKLALRTETTMNMFLQEHQFQIYMQPGPGSIIPVLLRGTQEWHQSDKALPLRHRLINLLWETLKSRLDQLTKVGPQDQSWLECQRLGIIDAKGNLPYLRWEASSKMLKPTAEAPLSLQEVVREVENVLRLVQDPTTTLRFHSLTKMTDSSDKTLPWLWMISSRNQPEAWHAVRKLCWHATWQLIRIQLKPQSADRSPLAKQIQQSIAGQ